MRLRALDVVAACPKCCAELVLHSRLAMHEPDLSEVWRIRLDLIQPSGKLGAGGMRAIAVDYDYFCIQRNFFIENLQYTQTLYHSPPQSMLGLEADDANLIARVRGSICQVVQNATVFSHSAAGYHDHRPVRFVDR